jgi:hypothetical protein
MEDSAEQPIFQLPSPKPPDVSLPDLSDAAPPEAEPARAAERSQAATADEPTEHVQLAPTVAPAQEAPFADDPNVHPVQEGANFHPADPRIAFAAVLSEAPRGLSVEDARSLGVDTPRGIKLYSAATGQWDLVCRLEDIPPGKWVRLLDRSGAPVAFELSALPAGLYVRWDDFAAPLQAWWPPGNAPPGWWGG